jgi:hypothetical protein
MNTPTSYLFLPGAYCHYLGGLSWSPEERGLVYPDDRTFAFSEEIAQFLEGLSSSGHPIHFAHVLHLLSLLRQPNTQPEASRLARLFTRAGRSLRNAGAFCAVVCHGVPAPAGPVSVQDVCELLRGGSPPIDWVIVRCDQAFAKVEEPALGPATFEQRVLARTALYSDDELLAWFRHGRGPIKDAGETLARALPRRTLEGVLGALLERPRLAGAGGFVAQLVGALALPPRRLERQELPVGGYSDVTAHGRLDQILPSQFALDELDFLRRLAEQELLYFRREEPPNPARQELIVLLDQGVRTWGDVRLVLQAAVLALGRQAARRGMPFLVATSAAGGEILDPLEEDAEALGERVEVSDLSANPGLAVEHVLESPSDKPRDLVLLTHPRSLTEPDVAVAARRLGARDRLFALTLDGHGSAELSELHRGVPVRLRQFHVDFTRSAPRPVKPAPEGPLAVHGPWRGEIEPIGYPFRFGVGGDVRWFAFDHAGEWLLAVAEFGMLHACTTDGVRKEILPRGMVEGRVLDHVHGVVGVAGGFVVSGQVGDQAVLFHYDLASQTCTRHLFGDVPPLLAPLHYLPEFHCIAAVRLAHQQGWVLDLATGWCHRADDTIDPGVRAAAAWAHCLSRGLPVRVLTVLSEPSGTALLDTHASDIGEPACHLEMTTGTVRLYGVPHVAAFIPQADGRALLRGAKPLAAQCCGTTLALLTTGPRPEEHPTLRLFRGPEGVPLASYLMDPRTPDFILSADGRWLARAVTQARVEIRRVIGDAGPVVTEAGGYSGPPALLLNYRCLLIRSGKHHAHLLRWETGVLQTAHARDGGASFTADSPRLFSHGQDATPAGVPAFLQYDPRRFLRGAMRKVIAVADGYGQVALFTRDGQLLAMFFAFREHLAGWMPDGTRLGPAWLARGAESRGAAEKFGRVLLDACGPERSPS